MAFERGSIVYLNSGSPPLTVNQVEDGLIWVNWFNGASLCTLGIVACCLTDKDPSAPAPAESTSGRVLSLVPSDPA